MKWVCDMEVDCQNGEDEDPKNKNISAGTGDKCRNEGKYTSVSLSGVHKIAIRAWLYKTSLALHARKKVNLLNV